MQVYPHPGGLRDQLNPDHTNPTLKPGGLSIGDSPPAHDYKLSKPSTTRTNRGGASSKEDGFRLPVALS
jgi:hypothetical protein